MPSDPAASSATLVVHTAVDDKPSPDHTLHAQVWIAATNGSAHNAVLKLRTTSRKVELHPTCTLTGHLTCRLGDLAAHGVTISLTITPPRQGKSVTFDLDATATASNATMAAARTTITLAPPPPPKPASPTPTPTHTSPSPHPTPTPNLPTLGVTASPTPSTLLPQVAPSPSTTSTSSSAPMLPAVLTASRGDRHGPFSHGVPGGESLGLLLIALAVFAVVVVPRTRKRDATSGTPLALTVVQLLQLRAWRTAGAKLRHFLRPDRSQ